MKQIKFNTCIEQLYLHSRYFNNKDKVLKELNVNPYQYVLVRYVAYDAHHDLVANPLSENFKKEIIRKLSKHYKVFLSMENNNTDDFYTPYIINVSPEKMHYIEANALFLISEGAAMESESFILGIPYF